MFRRRQAKLLNCAASNARAFYRGLQLKPKYDAVVVGAGKLIGIFIRLSFKL